MYGGRERGDSKGAVRRRPGCAQHVEGELSVEGTSAAAAGGGGRGRERRWTERGGGRETVKREHEGRREEGVDRVG